jgi:hypothetical protein
MVVVFLIDLLRRQGQKKKQSRGLMTSPWRGALGCGKVASLRSKVDSKLVLWWWWWCLGMLGSE